MKQGEIVLVPFPFTDLTSIKTRPALVISKNNSRDIILVGITSKNHHKSHKIDNKNLTNGTLPVTSYVRYDKIITIDKNLVRKRVANLNKTTLQTILKKFAALF